MRESRLLNKIHIVAAVLLLLGAVTNAIYLRAGYQTVLNGVDLVLTVFAAMLLVKRNRSWVLALPFACWVVLAFFAGSGPVAMVGEVVMNALSCLLILALFTERLPGLRPLARRFWFVPALIGYACRLIHLVLAVSRGETQGMLTAALLLVTAVDLGYLLAAKWCAEEA